MSVETHIVRSKMNYQDYKKIVLEEIKSVLKPHGFRKAANTFTANKNDVLWFVQLQSSSHTTRASLVATVNIGIVSMTLAEKEGLRSKPGLLDSHWRERIGFFLPRPHDKWWKIQNEQEAGKAGLEISQIIEKRALPELYSLSSTDQLVALWQTGRAPGLTEFQRKNLLARLLPPLPE